jgi:hypothetical protein
MSNSATSKTSESWTDIAKKAFSSGNLIAIILIIVVLLFIIVILWIIFSMKNKQLSEKQFLAKPVKLDALDTAFNVPNADLPTPKVGREYTYSFWIYVDKLDPKTIDGINSGMNTMVPQDKLVFYRGTADNITSANPIVSMDGQTNKLYIVIKTENSLLASGLQLNASKSQDEKARYLNTNDANTNLAAIRMNNYFLNKNISQQDSTTNKHIILTVDYVPLQRWVNITFVVDNKVCTVFMDGEIYSVKSTEEYKALRPKEIDIKGNLVNVNLIVDKTDGDIFVGKNKKISSESTPNGYFSRLRFFNYGVSLNEVRKIYNEGPVNGSLFGIPGISYGVRSPIYKLGT